VHFSLPADAFKSLVSGRYPELTRLDYGNAVLAGVHRCRLSRLQSTVNAGACLVYQANNHEGPRRCSPAGTPLAASSATHFIQFGGACLHGSASVYLRHEFRHLASLPCHILLPSPPSVALDVLITRRSTVDDRAFDVTAARF
jgi:hypothetical protein